MEERCGLSGLRSASFQGPVPPRTLAPIWLPHWPACRCTISRMAVELMLDSAALALVLMLRTAAAKAAVFSNITVQKHQFFSTQLSLQSNSHIHS